MERSSLLSLFNRNLPNFFMVKGPNKPLSCYFIRLYSCLMVWIFPKNIAPNLELVYFFRSKSQFKTYGEKVWTLKNNE